MLRPFTLYAVLWNGMVWYQIIFFALVRQFVRLTPFSTAEGGTRLQRNNNKPAANGHCSRKRPLANQHALQQPPNTAKTLTKDKAAIIKFHHSFATGTSGSVR